MIINSADSSDAHRADVRYPVSNCGKNDMGLHKLGGPNPLCHLALSKPTGCAHDASPGGDERRLVAVRTEIGTRAGVSGGTAGASRHVQALSVGKIHSNGHGEGIGKAPNTLLAKADAPGAANALQLAGDHAQTLHPRDRATQAEEYARHPPDRFRCGLCVGPALPQTAEHFKGLAVQFHDGDESRPKRRGNPVGRS